MIDQDYPDQWLEGIERLYCCARWSWELEKISRVDLGMTDVSPMFLEEFKNIHDFVAQFSSVELRG
jgi:hypothetical protein